MPRQDKSMHVASGYSSTCLFSLQNHVAMKAVLGCLVETVTGREQWRCVRMVCGVLCVMTNGILKMLLWYADN